MTGRLLQVKEVAEERRAFFTTKSLAAYFQVSERAVQRLLEERQIDSVRVGGSRRIPAESVDRFVARNLDKAR